MTEEDMRLTSTLQLFYIKLCQNSCNFQIINKVLCKTQRRILQCSKHFNFWDFAFGGYLLKVLFHFPCFQREINSFEESVKLNIQTFSILIYFNQLIFSRQIHKNSAQIWNVLSVEAINALQCWCQHNHLSMSHCCIQVLPPKLIPPLKSWNLKSNRTQNFWGNISNFLHGNVKMLPQSNLWDRVHQSENKRSLLLFRFEIIQLLSHLESPCSVVSSLSHAA